MFGNIISLKYYHYNIGISLISNSLIPCEFKQIAMYLPDIGFSSVNFFICPLFLSFLPVELFSSYFKDLYGYEGY